MWKGRSSLRWLFVLAACAAGASLHAANVPENTQRPGPGLENGGSWSVEGYGNGGSIERHNSQGRTILALQYKPGDKDRTAFKYVPGFHSAENRFTASFYADANGGPAVSIALSTGTKYVWHESKPIELKQGWNAISIPLSAPHWKTEATKWEYNTGVEPPDDVRAVTVMILNGKAAGRVYLDGVCPEPERSAEEKTLDTEDGWRAGWKRMARLGSGFIVWQSKRSGRWRIWRRDIDGTNERQLSPDEGDREHTAAHISPDGTRVVYVSLPAGQVNGTRSIDPKIVWPLYMVNSDGTGNRRIAENARTYHGERCAVWIDDQTLIYLGGNGSMRRLNLASGESTALFMEAGTKDPWLPDPTLRFVTRGYPPSFSRFDPAAQKTYGLFQTDGCQGYFTHDGAWGLWMGGSGGPVRVFNTTTLEQRSLLNRRDARMPADRNYLYFPMIARSGRLICFGASRNQHDHYHADYDIFMAEFDSKAMELAGPPVRYTFSPHPDTYPDAFLKPHELGTLRGEAPFSARFTLTPDDPAGWQWDYGDGAKGSAPEHVYTQAGDFAVLARKGAALKRGFVTVLPPAPPKITQSALSGGAIVRIDFDEEIDLEHAAVANAVGVALAKPRLLPGGRSMQVTLPAAPRAGETLTISGVRDRCAQPQRMPTQTITVYPNIWPARREGLRFLWDTGNKPNSAEVDGQSRTFSLESRSRAVLDCAFRMQLQQGSFFAKDLNLGDAPALSIEMTLWPSPAPGDIAEVFEFTDAQAKPVLGLRQYQGRWRVRSGNTDAAILGPVPEHGPVHVLLTVEKGGISWRLNGAPMPVETLTPVVLNTATIQRLFLGANQTGDGPWYGLMEGVALYARTLDEAEARENFERRSSIIAARTVPPQLEIEAVLKKASKLPTLKEIQPYRSGLFSAEYEVVRVLRGKYDASTIHVIHWALVNEATTRAAVRKPGERAILRLEPAAGQRQIEAYRCSDDWADDLELVKYFDTRL